MQVEFVPPEFAHALIGRVAEARSRAVSGFGQMPAAGSASEARYWEEVLEANAARVIGATTHTALASGHAVRYRFYDNIGGDLRIRPFVTRAGSDTATIKRLLDWHPPPDAQRGVTAAPAMDAELLYRHFSLARTPAGVFEYWFAIQEIWASTYWAHARVIVTAAELAHFLSRPEWRTELVVEHCAPAVIADKDGGSRLAVLVYSPVRHEVVNLEQIRVGPDQSIRYDDPIPVAVGPRGYMV